MCPLSNNIENFKDGIGAKLTNIEEFELVDFSVCFRFFIFAHRGSYNTLIHSKHDKDTLDALENPSIFGVVDWIINDESRLLLQLINTWNFTSILGLIKEIELFSDWSKKPDLISRILEYCNTIG